MRLKTGALKLKRILPWALWIPGVMTGMVLGSPDPMEAASIQIAIFTSIFVAGMIASNLLHYFTDSFFTEAAQLRGEMD